MNAQLVISIILAFGVLGSALGGPDDPRRTIVAGQNAPAYQAIMSASTNSAYAKSIGRSLSGWGSELLGDSFRTNSPLLSQDQDVDSFGIGKVRRAEQMFVGTTRSRCLIRLEYYEGASSKAVRTYFLEYVAPFYSAGIPPVNKTYGIGDLVLAWLDREAVRNRAHLIVFFNNIAVKCDISSEDGEVPVDIDPILKKLEAWAKGQK